MNERAVRGVVIDSGHGGTDPGAVSGNLKEKDFTLKASLYMYERLKQLGIPVALVKDKDETLSRTERINRAKNAFGNGSDVILVSNHINAGGGEGAEVVYALRNRDTLARTALENIAQAGQISRKYYQRRLPEDPMQDYYYIIRDTSPMESILVEYGFIDNKNDAKRLQTNLLDYVEGVVKALATYTNTTYTPPTSQGEIDHYIVQRGDSLWSIANKHDMTVDELRKLNNLMSDSLQIGQMLKVKSSSEESVPTLPSDNTYVVKRGDSLWEIAEKFHTTVAELKRLNNLQSNDLSVGQTLIIRESSEAVIPTPEPGQPMEEYTIYTVEHGDSLWVIATKFNTTVNEIIQLNNLTSNVLSIGQQLKIPGTEKPTPPPPSIPEAEKPSGEYDIYVVVSDDSLWKIANRYGTTVDELININNLTTTDLTIGQQLKVPRTTLNNTYVIQSGDSLWSISKKFDISVDHLKQLNGLKNNTLQIGQVLIIS